MRVHVADHPLIAHKLTYLRDQRTDSPTFRRLAEELVTLLAYEATREVRVEPFDIETPVAPTKGIKLARPKPVIVPILRAGLGMLGGVVNMIPAARVGHVGLYRDPETLKPVEYYCKLPSDVAERMLIVVDPMLATGGSSSAALTLLKEKGAKSITLMCLVAAPEGIRLVNEEHPDVPIYVAAVDDHLNEKGYIVPGLGDAGDRIFGTL